MASSTFGLLNNIKKKHGFKENIKAFDDTLPKRNAIFFRNTDDQLCYVKLFYFSETDAKEFVEIFKLFENRDDDTFDIVGIEGHKKFNRYLILRIKK